MKRTTTLDTTQSFNALLHQLIPPHGIKKETFDEEHVEAVIKDAFKNGSVQEPIYGRYAYIGHESLARPTAPDGKSFSISKISNLFYRDGLAEKFDLLTSSLGMKKAEKRPLTLNISVETALKPSFFDEIKRRMERHSLTPQDIIFEILEHDVNRTADITHLETLKNDGFRFALDDFSLARKDKTVSNENKSRISTFGHVVDFVKIDGPLVRAYFEDTFHGTNRHDKDKTYTADDFKTALATIRETMPHVRIIAERVQNKQEADELFDIGITGVQGWNLDPADFPYTPESQSAHDHELQIT